MGVIGQRQLKQEILLIIILVCQAERLLSRQMSFRLSLTAAARGLSFPHLRNAAGSYVFWLLPMIKLCVKIFVLAVVSFSVGKFCIHSTAE